MGVVNGVSVFKTVTPGQDFYTLLDRLYYGYGWRWGCVVDYKIFLSEWVHKKVGSCDLYSSPLYRQTLLWMTSFSVCTGLVQWRKRQHGPPTGTLRRGAWRYVVQISTVKRIEPSTTPFVVPFPRRVYKRVSFFSTSHFPLLPFLSLNPLFFFGTQENEVTSWSRETWDNLWTTDLSGDGD